MQAAKVLRASGRFRWLDSVVVHKPQKRVIAYARYGHTADVTELQNALAKAGFAASAIRLNAEPERTTGGHR